MYIVEVLVRVVCKFSSKIHEIENQWCLKNKRVLIDMSSMEYEIWKIRSRSRHEGEPSWVFDYIPRGLKWKWKNRAK